MMGLTRQQSRVLEIIRDANSHGTAPTYAELCEDLGLAGKSGVHRMIVALEERGAIRRLPGRARALEAIATPGATNLRDLSTRDLQAMRDQIDRVLRARAA